MAAAVWYAFNTIYIKFQTEKIAVLISVFFGALIYFMIMGASNTMKAIRKEFLPHNNKNDK